LLQARVNQLQSKFILFCLTVALLSGCNGRVVAPGDGHRDFGYLNKRVQKRGKVSAQLLTADEMANRRRESISVWFVRPAADSQQGEKFEFVPVARAYKPSADSDNATCDALEFAVNELLRGPGGDSGASSEIPRGTVVIAVRNVSARPGANEGEKGGIVIDLSRHFLAGGGLDSMETRLAQLKRTVNEVAAGEPVYLNVEGQRLTQTPGDGLEVAQPINR
jgi:spore germination protein GerM